MTQVKPDPAGRTCSDCRADLDEVIPLDENGICHGCGANYGKSTTTRQGYTKGPWLMQRGTEYHDDSTLDRPYYSIWIDPTEENEGWKISGYIARVDGMRGDRLEANARLIAAAPEMALALETIAASVNGLSGELYKMIQRSAEAALRKAGVLL